MLCVTCKKNVPDFGRYVTPREGPGKNFQKYTDKSSFQVIAEAKGSRME